MTNVHKLSTTACEHTSNLLITSAFKHNCQRIWVHECPITWTSKPLSIGACDHRSKLTCEHVIIKASTHVSMLSTKHDNIASKNLNIKASKHWSMWPSKQVDMWACDHQSKYTCEHVINKACEHTSTWEFKHRRIHTSYRPITLKFKNEN